MTRFVAVLSTLVFLLTCSSAYAESESCFCTHRTSLFERHEDAASIFIAEIDEVFREDEETRRQDAVKATFQVLEIFKGEPRFSELKTANKSYRCGVDFRAGERYLVFATQDGIATLCSGTGEVRGAAGYLEALDAYYAGENHSLIVPWSLYRSPPSAHPLCILSKAIGDRKNSAIKFRVQMKDQSSTRDHDPIAFVTIWLPSDLKSTNEPAYVESGNFRSQFSRGRPQTIYLSGYEQVIALAQSLNPYRDVVVGPLVVKEPLDKMASPIQWSIPTFDLGDAHLRFVECAQSVKAQWDDVRATAGEGEL